MSFSIDKWKYSRAEEAIENGDWYRITNKDNELVAVCTKDKDTARLIAAAPEMYDFIEDVTWCFEQLAKINDDLAEDAERGRELLARVDGKERRRNS